MSLETDGFWKAGFWATTFWADGFWREGVVADDITLNDLPEAAVFKRTAGVGTVGVSGTYSGTTPDEIRYRILAYPGLAEVQAFAPLVGAVIELGAWAGVMVPPEGGYYVVEVESRLAGVTLDTATGANPWAVGEIWMLAGSSSPHEMFHEGTGVPGGLVSKYEDGAWAAMDATGAGANELGNLLATRLGVPVGLVNAGDGGTKISGWEDRNSTEYQTALAYAQATNPHGLIFCAGLNDSQDFEVASIVSHMAKIAAVRTHFREDLGLPDWPHLIMSTQRSNEPEYIGAAFDIQANRVREAELRSDDPANGVYLAALRVDLNLRPDLQHTTASMDLNTAERLDHTIGYLYGLETDYRGPSISEITSHPNPNRVRVQITLPDDATTLSPANVVSVGADTAGFLTGFFATDDDGDLEITAVDRQSSPAVHYRLTFARNYVMANGGLPAVGYQRGGCPGEPDDYYDEAIRDNQSGLTLPLEPRTLYEDEVPTGGASNGARRKKFPAAAPKSRWNDPAVDIRDLYITTEQPSQPKTPAIAPKPEATPAPPREIIPAIAKAIAEIGARAAPRVDAAQRPPLAIMLPPVARRAAPPRAKPVVSAALPALPVFTVAEDDDEVLALL